MRRSILWLAVVLLILVGLGVFASFQSGPTITAALIGIQPDLNQTEVANGSQIDQLVNDSKEETLNKNKSLTIQPIIDEDNSSQTPDENPTNEVTIPDQTVETSLPKENTLENEFDQSQEDGGVEEEPLIPSSSNGSLFGTFEDFTILAAPTASSLVLNSTDISLNSTHQNVTAYWNIADTDGDPVKNITNWYLDGTSISVLHMPFEQVDDSEFNATKDYSGFENNGSEQGGATWNATGGYDGKGAFEFDGSNDQISFPNSASLDITEEMTISMWVRPEITYDSSLTNYIALLSRQNSNGDSYFLAFNADGKLHFGSQGGNIQSTQTSWSANTWYHVVGTYRDIGGSYSGELYVNGEYETLTVDNYDNMAGVSDILTIGYDSRYGAHFQGAIDEVMIFNRTLTPEQVSNIYNNRTHLLDSNETLGGEIWNFSITPNDGTSDGTTLFSSNITIEQLAALNLTLNSTDVTLNNSNQNLSASWNLNFQPGLPVKNITNWHLNGSSITILNMPFEKIEDPIINATKDYSDFDNNGSEYGGVTWNSTSGYDGKGAYELDGSNDYIRSTIEHVDVVSVSIWFNTTDKSTNQRIISKTESAEYQLSLNENSACVSGTLCFLVRVGSTYYDATVSTSSISNNVWHHAVGTYDGETVNLYLDGILVGQDTSASGSITSASTPLCIGAEATSSSCSGQYFKGAVDDVMIFNQSLSPEQVLNIYNNRTHLLDTNDTSINDIWSISVTPNDGVEDGVRSFSNNITIQSYAPTVVGLVLNSSTPFNRSVDNLEAHWTSTDLDNDPIKNITSWYLNQSPIASIIMPFESNSTHSNARDYSGNDNHATSISGATWDSDGGFDGKGAYDFDGSNDVVTISGGDTINITEQITIAVWIYPHDTTSEYDRVVSRAWVTDAAPWNVYALNRVGSAQTYNFCVGFTDSTSQCSTTTSSAPLNQWTYLVGTYDGTKTNVYFNGVLQDSDANTRTIQTNSIPITIGANYHAREYFNGLIDEVMILNKSLSAEQILDLYNNRTNTLHASDLSVGDAWNVSITPNDGASDGTTVLSESITIEQNMLPEVTNLILNASSPQLLTEDNLTAYWSVSDNESDPIKNITNWYLNGTSITVLHMPFEKVDDSTINATKDYSGFDNNGSEFGPTWNATGGFDGKGAFEFDGSNDYISITNSSDFPDGLNSRSFCVWAYPDSLDSNYRSVFGWGNDATSEAFFISRNGATIYGGGYGNDISVGSFWELNTWKHVCLTYDGATARLYGDGALIGSAAKTWNLRRDWVFIGAQLTTPASEFWTGKIDDIMAFNITLTPEQVLNIYNNRTNILDTNETSDIDLWNFSVTPNDGFADGTTIFSEGVTIQVAPVIDSVTLNRTSFLDEDHSLTVTTSVVNPHYVNATIVDENGKIVVLDTNTTTTDGVVWNSSGFNLNQTFNYTVVAFGISGLSANVSGSFSPLVISHSPNMTTVYKNENITVTGRINFTNNTLAANTGFNVYINNSLAITQSLNSPSQWFDPAWAHREEFVFQENNGSDLDLFQVNVTVDTQNLVSQGKMNSDCSDIRFVDNESELLDYWIEDNCNTQNTHIWVEANFTANSNNSLFMYYGNSGADNASNSTNTLVLYEDFTTAPKGTLQGNASYESDGQFVQLTGVVTGANGNLNYSGGVDDDGFVTEFRFWTGGGNGADAMWFHAYSTGIVTSEDGNNGGYLIAFDEWDNDQIQLNYAGARIATDGQTTLDNSQWRDVKIVHYQEQTEIYFDGTLEINYTDSNRAKTGSFFGWGARTGGAHNEHRITNATLRKYIALPPSLESSGVEESQISTGSNGDFEINITAPSSGGTFPLVINLTTKNSAAQVSFNLNVLSPPVIESIDLNSTAYFNGTFNLIANVTDDGIDYVNFSLVDADGTQVVSDVNSTSTDQVLWNSSSFDLTRESSYNYTVTVVDNDNLQASSAGPIDFLLITSSLNPSTANSGSATEISGVANFTNGTVAFNRSYQAYINNSLSTPDSWWNSNWNYRKEIKIQENNNTSLSDFQVNLSIDTQTLISQGKLNSDCSDLRFTLGNDTEQSFWIQENQSACNTTTTKIWVEMSNLTALENTSLFMYYGSSGAANASNGSATFIFFDDFESYSSEADMQAGGWQDISINNGDMQFSSNGGVAGSKALQLDEDDGNGWDKAEAYYNVTNFSKGIALEWDWYEDDDDFFVGVNGFNDDISITTGCDSDQGNNVVAVDGNCDSSNDVFITGASGSKAESDVDFTRTGWKHAEIVWDDTSKFILNGVEMASRTTNIPTTDLALHFSEFPEATPAGGPLGRFDNILIRQNSPLMPSSFIQEEESIFTTNSAGSYSQNITAPSGSGVFPVIVNISYKGYYAQSTLNLIVDSGTAPLIQDFIPQINALYNEVTNATIAINVTDDGVIDTALANILLPNSTVDQVTLNFNSSNRYNEEYLTPLLPGDYNVTFLVNDTGGYINNSEGTNFTVLDTREPNLSSLIPEQNSVFNVSNIIEIGANISDHGSIADVLANVSLPNRSIKEITLTSDLGDSHYNTSYSIPPVSGDYNVTFIVNDSAGNVNETQMINFTANDIIIPNVTSVLPLDSQSFLQNQRVSFSSDVRDDVNVSIVLANITLPNSQNYLLELIYNFSSSLYESTFVGTSQLGQYNVTILANDTSSNLNDSETTFFAINDSGALVITNVTPLITDSVNQSIPINISASVSGSSFVSTVRANLSLPNGSIKQVILLNTTSPQTFTQEFNTTNLAGGYNITILANDTENNISFAQTYFTVNDITDPNITSLGCFPAAAGYNSTVICNVTSSDNIKVIEVEANVTYPNGSIQGVQTFFDGSTHYFSFNDTEVIKEYNVSWSAKDSSNNLNETNSQFNITQPAITLLGCSPNPANISNSVVCQANVTTAYLVYPVQNVTANLTFPNSTIRVLNVSNESTIYNITVDSTNAIGLYRVIWEGNDSIGSTATNSDTFLIEDVVYPTVLDTVPSLNSQYVVGSQIEIALNATDDVAISQVYANVTYANNTAELVELQSDQGSRFNITYTVLNITGAHSITYLVNDTSNNLNNTNSTNFTAIDIASPVIVGQAYPLFDSNYNETQTISIAANITDDVEISQVFVNITYPNATRESLEMSFDANNRYLRNFLAPTLQGNYTILFIANDTSNNINGSVQTNFSVDVVDVDYDGVSDRIDRLVGNESTIRVGNESLNVSLNGSKANGTFVGMHDVLVYNESSLVLNFSHNFSLSAIDLRNITINITNTGIMANLREQLAENETKTLYIEDNNFVQLCAKDSYESSLSGISTDCTGSNETDFDSCIGSSAGVTIGNLTCYDEGSRIRVENLSHSALLGISATPTSSSTGGSGGSSSGGGGSGCGPGFILKDGKCKEIPSDSSELECTKDSECSNDNICIDNKCILPECSTSSDCPAHEYCINRQCFKIFDLDIKKTDRAASPGSDFKGEVFIKSVSSQEGDVTLNYWLEKDGVKVTSQSKVIFVGIFEQRDVPFVLTIPSTTKPGVYDLKVSLQFDDYKIESHRTVEVKTKRGPIVGQAILTSVGDAFSDYTIVWLVAILAIVVIVLIVYTHKTVVHLALRRKEREDTVIKEKRSFTPQVKLAVAQASKAPKALFLGGQYIIQGIIKLVALEMKLVRKLLTRKRKSPQQVAESRPIVSVKPEQPQMGMPPTRRTVVPKQKPILRPTPKPQTISRDPIVPRKQVTRKTIHKWGKSSKVDYSDELEQINLRLHEQDYGTKLKSHKSEQPTTLRKDNFVALRSKEATSNPLDSITTIDTLEKWIKKMQRAGHSRRKIKAMLRSSPHLLQKDIKQAYARIDSTEKLYQRYRLRKYDIKILADYIQSASRKGISKRQIFDQLVRKGWDIKIVEEFVHAYY